MQTEVHWDLEGRPKAGNTGTTPLLYDRFHVLELPVQNLTFLKFCMLNFRSFYFRITQASCEIYENLHHSKISRYTVCTVAHEGGGAIVRLHMREVVLSYGCI